ncbi:hypothetical protein QZH41_011188, partial [Actinostola sp. cb2023]
MLRRIQRGESSVLSTIVNDTPVDNETNDNSKEQAATNAPITISNFEAEHSEETTDPSVLTTPTTPVKGLPCSKCTQSSKKIRQLRNNWMTSKFKLRKMKLELKYALKGSEGVDSSQVPGTPPGELDSSEDCMNVDSDCYESEYDFTEEEPEDDRDDSYEGKTDTDTATDTDDETDSRIKPIVRDTPDWNNGRSNFHLFEPKMQKGVCVEKSVVHARHQNASRKFVVVICYPEITKTLTKLSKESGCDVVAKWTKACGNHFYWSACSTHDGNGDVIWAKFCVFLSHIINKHDKLQNPIFNKCQHGPDFTARQWLHEDSVVYDKLRKALTKPNLQKAIKKASPIAQTSCLEGFHSVLNQFAPKMIHYSFSGMYCRHILAILHFNSNLHRDIKLKNDGSQQVKVVFPKFKNGEGTVRDIRVKPNFAYVEEIFQTLQEDIQEKTRLDNAIQELTAMTPAHMDSMLEKQPKEDAIHKRQQRQKLQTKDVPPTTPDGQESFIRMFVSPNLEINICGKFDQNYHNKPSLDVMILSSDFGLPVVCTTCTTVYYISRAIYGLNSVTNRNLEQAFTRCYDSVFGFWASCGMRDMHHSKPSLDVMILSSDFGLPVVCATCTT